MDAADRKIGLSRKRLTWTKEESEEAEAAEEAAEGKGAGPKRELRGGTGAGGGQLFSMPEPPAPEKE